MYYTQGLLVLGMQPAKIKPGTELQKHKKFKTTISEYEVQRGHKGLLLLGISNVTTNSFMAVVNRKAQSASIQQSPFEQSLPSEVTSNFFF